MSNTSSQQLQRFQSNGNDILSIQQSTYIRVMEDNQSPVIQGMEEPKNVSQLQVMINYDLKDLTSGKKDIFASIKQNLRDNHTNLGDVIHNISTMIPGQSEISNEYAQKYIFDKMNENIKDLKGIANKLQRLFQEVQGSIMNYKEKLITMKNTIRQQSQSKTDFKMYMKKYCEAFFKDDFDKIKQYQDQLIHLYSQLIEIQDQDEMRSLNNITKEGINIDLIKEYDATNNPMIQSFRDQIKAIQEEVKESLRNIQLKEMEISQVEQEEQQANEMLSDLEKEIASNQAQFDQCVTSLSQVKSQGVQHEIDQISKKRLEELSQKKQDGFNKIYNLRIKSQEKQQIIMKSVTEKMDRFTSIGKSYHFVILLDDSGSMHEKIGGGMFQILNSTAFDHLSETIKYFVESRKRIKGCEDTISIVKFSTQAIVIHKKENIQSINLNLSKNSQKGGTNFNAAFEVALSLVMLKSKDQTNMLIFQTDGDSSTTDKCKEFLTKIKTEDPNVKMFTIGLGKYLKEDFLKQITSFANSGEEILNKGSKFPLNFYQQSEDVHQLGQIFTDISLGISGQMEEIQKEIKQKQEEQQDFEKKYQQKIEKLEKQLLESQTDIEQSIQQMQAIKNIKETTAFLEGEKENLIKKKQQLIEQKSEQSAIIKDSKVKLKNLRDEVKDSKDTHAQLKANKVVEITNLEKQIQAEIQENSDYKANQANIMKIIGCKDEVKVKIWIKATSWFEYFLRIITAFTQKFKLFFDRFKDISYNLQLQIDDENTSVNRNISQQNQIDLLALYFSGHEIILSKVEDNIFGNKEISNDSTIKEQTFKKTKTIGIEEIVELIIQEKYHIAKTDDGDEDEKIKCALQKAKKFFLTEAINIEDLLKTISYNQPTVSQKVNENNDEEETMIEYLEQKIKKEQKVEIDVINSKINDLLSDIIRLKVVSASKISKVKNLKNIDDICNEIKDFDFDSESESESESESDSDSESSSGSDSGDDNSSSKQTSANKKSDSDEEDEEKEKKNQQSQKSSAKKKKKEQDEEEQQKEEEKEKKKKQKKKKSKKNKSGKKKPKKIKITEEDVKQIVKKFKKLGKKKIELLSSHQLEQRTMKKVFNLIDNQLTDILDGFSISKKAHQINNLQKYIQKEMIDPLDELLSFTSKKQKQES